MVKIRIYGKDIFMKNKIIEVVSVDKDSVSKDVITSNRDVQVELGMRNKPLILICGWMGSEMRQVELSLVHS